MHKASYVVSDQVPLVAQNKLHLAVIEFLLGTSRIRLLHFHILIVNLIGHFAIEPGTVALDGVQVFVSDFLEIVAHLSRILTLHDHILRLVVKLSAFLEVNLDV